MPICSATRLEILSMSSSSSLGFSATTGRLGSVCCNASSAFSSIRRSRYSCIRQPAMVSTQPNRIPAPREDTPSRPVSASPAGIPENPVASRQAGLRNSTPVMPNSSPQPSSAHQKPTEENSCIKVAGIYATSTPTHPQTRKIPSSRNRNASIPSTTPPMTMAKMLCIRLLT